MNDDEPQSPAILKYRQLTEAIDAINAEIAPMIIQIEDLTTRNREASIKRDALAVERKRLVEAYKKETGRPLKRDAMPNSVQEMEFAFQKYVKAFATVGAREAFLRLERAIRAHVSDEQARKAATTEPLAPPAPDTV